VPAIVPKEKGKHNEWIEPVQDFIHPHGATTCDYFAHQLLCIQGKKLVGK
jgi:hypothetical protein